MGRFIGRFRECYFKAGSMNPSTGVVFSYTPRPGAEEQIYQRISDITISMKAMDYLKMPECISVNHEVEMSTAERKLYDGFSKERDRRTITAGLSHDGWGKEGVPQ